MVFFTFVAADLTATVEQLWDGGGGGGVHRTAQNERFLLVF